jgi:hypothetical protein
LRGTECPIPNHEEDGAFGEETAQTAMKGKDTREPRHDVRRLDVRQCDQVEESLHFAEVAVNSRTVLSDRTESSSS